jgi:ATP-dependent Clp endopeptidase proteolytic subunit ClpP
MAELKIYGAIGDWAGWLDDYVTASQVYDFLADNKDQDVDVYINSGGGVVDDGIAIYNALKRHQGKVTIYVDGIAASAASVIAMAGDEVIMYESSMMMVHEPWTMTAGNADGMRKTADVLDMRRDQLLAAYREKTGIDDNDLKALLADETWLSADDALAFGFIDRIAGDPIEDLGRLMASVYLPECVAVPERIAAMVGTLPSRDKHKPAAPVAAQEDEEAMSQKEQGAAEVTPNVDVVALRAQERERIQCIQNKGRILGLSTDQVDAVVAMDLPVAESCLAMVDIKAQSPVAQSPITGVNPSATVTVDRFDKFKAAAEGAVLASAGLKTEHKTNMRGMTLSDVAREFCAMAGLQTTGTREQVLGRALAFVGGSAGGHGTADFKQVLKDAANKSLLVSFEEYPTIYQEFCKIGSVQNFQPHHRVGLGTFDSLEELPEGSEIKAANINDRGEAIKAKEYGKIINITRQALVNDSLSVFAELPAVMGRAAARTIDSTLLALILGNPTLANAGVQLFNADNTGTDALGEVGLINGRTKMRRQKDGENALDIRPAFLLTGAAAEPLAEKLMSSIVKVGGTNDEPNMVANMARVISHPAIDDYIDTAGLTHWWALLGDPRMIDTLEVAFLNGVMAPRIDFEDQFNLSGTSGRAIFDFAVGALEWRGVYRSQNS